MKSLLKYALYLMGLTKKASEIKGEATWWARFIPAGIVTWLTVELHKHFGEKSLFLPCAYVVIHVLLMFRVAWKREEALENHLARLRSASLIVEGKISTVMNSSSRLGKPVSLIVNELKFIITNTSENEVIENIRIKVIKEWADPALTSGFGILMNNLIGGPFTLNPGQSETISFSALNNFLLRAFRGRFPNGAAFTNWVNSDDRASSLIEDVHYFFDVQITSKKHPPLTMTFKIVASAKGKCLLSEEGQPRVGVYLT